MLYFVQRGDTLVSIARRFKVALQEIMLSNVICNPNLIAPGQPLIIPKENLKLPKSGGNPYYIVMPGDNLYCIAGQFKTSTKALSEGNQINNSNEIFVGDELLITYEKPNGKELYNTWKTTGDRYCGEMSSLQLHGVYYIGTFMWQSLGMEALDYLKKLMKHSCEDVRYYTALSLGRLGQSDIVAAYLSHLSKDSDNETAEMAALALKRVSLVKRFGKRIHVTTDAAELFTSAAYEAPFISLPKGTAVKVLKWGIPSPTGEIGPRGDIQIYDYVQVLSTGQPGFMARVGYNSIQMI